MNQKTRKVLNAVKDGLDKHSNEVNDHVIEFLSLYPPFQGNQVKLYYKCGKIHRFTTLDEKEQAELEIDPKKLPIKKGSILEIPIV